MSEMPHCEGVPDQARCEFGTVAVSIRIREINQNLRNSEIGVSESKPHIWGLRKAERGAFSAGETALKVLRTVTGCTIGVYKCIQ